jgi:hypothetical protein
MQKAVLGPATPGAKTASPSADAKSASPSPDAKGASPNADAEGVSPSPDAKSPSDAKGRFTGIRVQFNLAIDIYYFIHLIMWIIVFLNCKK